MDLALPQPFQKVQLVQTAMLKQTKPTEMEASSLDEWGPSPSTAEIDWSAEETVGYGHPPLPMTNGVEEVKQDDIPPHFELQDS